MCVIAILWGVLDVFSHVFHVWEEDKVFLLWFCYFGFFPPKPLVTARRPPRTSSGSWTPSRCLSWTCTGPSLSLLNIWSRGWSSWPATWWRPVSKGQMAGDGHHLGWVGVQRLPTLFFDMAFLVYNWDITEENVSQGRTGTRNPPWHF